MGYRCQEADRPRPSGAGQAANWRLYGGGIAARHSTRRSARLSEAAVRQFRARQQHGEFRADGHGRQERLEPCTGEGRLRQELLGAPVGLLLLQLFVSVEVISVHNLSEPALF